MCVFYMCACVYLFVFQNGETLTVTLTNELDGLREEHTYVRSKTVFYCQSLIGELGLKQVRTGGRYIQHCCDATGCQRLSLRRMMGTAQVKEGKDLYRPILLTKPKQTHTRTHTYSQRLVIAKVTERKCGLWWWSVLIEVKLLPYLSYTVPLKSFLLL